jgi:type IX secretion system PorP/SprF family membrane protein
MSCIEGILGLIWWSFIFIPIYKRLYKMKKLLLGVSVAALLPGGLLAQDIHFTQYFTSPLTLNPAMTGLVADDLRFSGNYRTQWASVSPNPYTTASVSFDIATMKGKLPEGDALGIGVLGFLDKAGSGGLTNTTVGASLAYHKAFGRDRKQHLSFGLQGMLVQKNINFAKLTFEDMYNEGTGTLMYKTNEVFNNVDLTYPDINLGVMYSGQVADNITFYLGYSQYHLTRPVETFLNDNTNRINARHTGYVGGSFDMNPNTVLYASGIVQSQGGATEVAVGAAVGFVLNPEHDEEFQRNTILYLGGWYRYRDAVSPYLGLEWSKMRVGISYDINVSTFTPATRSAGGYELSLIYFGRINKRERNPNYNWSCPKLY